MAQEEEGVFVASVKRRIEENGNAVIAILGAIGSGKSYFALRLGEIFDKEFSIEKISFNPSTFLELIHKHGKGACLVMDDAGLTIPARQFMSISNQFISIALETCRFKNQLLIMTMPSLSMVDKNARRLLAYCFWMKSINRQKEESTATMYFVSSNPIQDKIYYKHPMRGNVQYDTLTVSKPSKELIEAYEAYKSKYLNDLYRDMERQLREIEGKQRIAKDRIDEVIAELRKKGWSYAKIGNKIGMTGEAVRYRAKRIGERREGSEW